MRIAIYGAGSLGTVLGAYFSKGKVDVDLFSRNREHIQALSEKGAHIVGTVDFTVPVHAYLPEEMEGKYDLIILLTKQLDNHNVLLFLKDHLAEEGDILTMQNGFPELSVSEVVGKEHTMGCSVAWGATLLGKGESELTSAPDSMSFGLGRMDGSIDDRLMKAKAILETMCPVVLEKNFVGMRFSKLLINSAFSGMSAVLGTTFGEASKDRKSRICVQNIIKECIDVAKANNIHIEPIQGKDVVKLLDYHGPIKKKVSFMLIPLCIKKHALLKASMLQDLEKGKKCEVDSINGVVCAFGKKAGVRTPYNDMVVKVIHDIEDGKATPSIDNLSYFASLEK